MVSTVPRAAVAVLCLALVATACGGDDGARSLTVYSGRKQEIVAPLLDRFEASTGIDLDVRYASSPDLAATLREEGGNTPADVFFAVDPASLGAVAEAGMLTPLPDDLLALVPAGFSDRDGRWVGTSGRSRVVVHDAARVTAAALPDTVAGFTDPAWRGRLAIAPSNGSFLAFVAAMILSEGEEATRDWLRAIAANRPLTYANNSAIVAAVDTGEVDVGLTNHYYLLQRRAEVGATDAANHFLAVPGAGALVMPAGVGILAGTDAHDEALAFVEFLLSDEAQRYFAAETFEYPVVAGVAAHGDLPPLESLAPPQLDLSDLASVLDLATDLVAEAGLL
jgi:iron(III) transport system substrate-binding protein